MSIKHNAVPLPNVSEYTDQILFQNLGLPIGFDEERLLVNVSGLERVCRWAGFNGLLVSGAYLKGANNDFTMTDISNEDVAAIGAAHQSNVGKDAKARVRDLAGLMDQIDAFQPPEEDAERLEGAFGKFALRAAKGIAKGSLSYTLDVKIDLSNKDNFMREKKCRVLDAGAQAQFINQELRQSLRLANSLVSVGKDQWAVAALAGAFGTVPIVLVDSVLQSKSLLTHGAPVAVVASELVFRAVSTLTLLNAANGDGYGDYVKPRLSMLVGATPEHYVAGRVAIESQRFIRAQK